MLDKSWEKFGEKDPFFAVITDPQFKSGNLTEEGLKRYFESGEEYVSNLLKKLEKGYEKHPNSTFKHILDFGCGNARLLIPFSKHAESVTGVDISQSMLNEAKKNIEARKINNIQLLQTTDISTVEFPGCFDLVHTFIVLQHIPPSMGYSIINKLISLVCEGGHGVIHFTFANKKSAFKNKITAFKNKHYWIRKVSFLLRGKSVNTPVMQMNNYSLEKVFRLLLSHNINQIDIELTNHGGFLGTVVHFQK